MNGFQSAPKQTIKQGTQGQQITTTSIWKTQIKKGQYEFFKEVNKIIPGGVFLLLCYGTV